MQHAHDVTTRPSRPRPFRPFVLVAMLLAALGLVPLLGCSSSDDASTPDGAPAAGREAAAAAKEQGATVVDVRTPEEFDAGHVDGAELIDFQSAGFAQQVAELDPSVSYVVYCRSGNRSAQAAVQMRDAGLTVLDGGGLEDMVAAGWPTA